MAALFLKNEVISAPGGARNTSAQTGALTSISRAQIATLPTLSRSLQDFTRLTPQANGNSFGGASNRLITLAITGAVNNDVFGLLLYSGTPGGQAATTWLQWIIQEIQVVLARRDITYGNLRQVYTAVTRSGTNNIQLAYYFMRNENTVGKDPVSRIKTADFSDKQYGIRIGAPIIKNKLLSLFCKC